MYDLTNINTLHRIFEKNGFNLKKGLGQNFIVDPEVCPQIALHADIDGEGVIEIGPGAGVLTCELAKRAKKVVCIELDTKLKPILADTLSDFDNVEVIFADVMKCDLKAIINQHFKGMNVSVCANLPYYITSPIIMMLLETLPELKSITVMVQKEAAIRLCAEMGTRECGAVTAAVRYYSSPQQVLDVPRDSFLPPPKVDSAVIKLTVNSDNQGVNRSHFFKVIKAAFSMRRKTLLNCLSAHLDGCDKAKVLNALEQCGISPTARAEELTMDQYIALCKTILGE
ncbi:MAG: 16S rRNA (adenine(1518)-N(6)/adenine(1519)-N(6))-dimethyltransferase RsmA [Clostridia bacterium]|nr:16S rRNA (adenine(1518)-N(6)/adenine(1519)-N(6))-dimethyltransferase RsmA [Clostridia bacterium]